MITLSAIIVLLILALLTIFQIALIFGAPLGHFAWGGANRVLTPQKRIGSVTSIAIYAGIALFIISKAHFALIIQNETVLAAGLWILFIYFLTGVVLNGMSPSVYERYTMTPVCVVLAGCLFILATG